MWQLASGFIYVKETLLCFNHMTNHFLISFIMRGTEKSLTVWLFPSAEIPPFSQLQSASQFDLSL